MRLSYALVGLTLSTAVGGCIFGWSNESSAGPFLTDITVVHDRLSVQRCAVDYKVTHVIAILPVPSAGGVGADSAESTTQKLSKGSCTVESHKLPAGILPSDGLDAVPPPWCARSVKRWYDAVMAARWAEYRRRRAACFKVRDKLREEAQHVATLKERKQRYDAMPDCDAVRFPLDAPSTPAQDESWAAIPDACRPYTGVAAGAAR